MKTDLCKNSYQQETFLIFNRAILFLLVLVLFGAPSLSLASSSEIVDDDKKAMYESKTKLNESLDENREYDKAEIDKSLRQAEVATKTANWQLAEDLYLRVLTYDLIEEDRRDVLFRMIKLYEASGASAKQVAVLEKFCDMYPSDPTLPQVFIRVGIVYREMGLYKLALARFYSVLNYALRIDENQIEEYKKLSMRAQLEIADTHFMMGEYKDAIGFYEKLRLLDISAQDRVYVTFQMAYSYYLLGENPKAIMSFRKFIEKYPESEMSAEATFLLSNTYSRMGRTYEAAGIVMKLLGSQDAQQRPDDWVYWQRKAGNQLANDFFKLGDYASALSIYQALRDLSDEASWQWPILYQTGLCFEHLKMNEKAIESYNVIIEWPNEGRLPQREIAMRDSSLKSIYEMATWRLENIGWKKESAKELEKLLDKSNS